MAAARVDPPQIPRACLAIAAGALLVRLALAARPLVFLDRLFVPDDTYYTLTIARSLARGDGPTVDGVHLTNGFQPLLAFLLAPVLRVLHDPDHALRAAFAVGACADAITTWLVGHLAFRLGRGSTLAALIASTTWALSSSAIATSLNGLESSLGLACTLGALAAWSAPRARRSSLAWALSGGVLGLCLLARVDTIFFVVIVGGTTLWRTGLRATAASVAGATIVVSPWWVYSLARFGTVVPESGAAVLEQTLAYKASGTTVRDQIAWAAGAVTGPPLFDSTWLRQALGKGASGIGCAVGIVLVVAALDIARRRRQKDELRILAAYAACAFLFYALVLPAIWFFRRYLVPVHAFTGIAFAVGAARAWELRGERPWVARAVAALAGVCAVAAMVTLVRFATSAPLVTVDQEYHGVKGYREPARQILALAPPGAVIGTFQSGALGWVADGSGRRVVNLDGVVDGEAARAVREHRLAAFARGRGVTYLADWEVNVDLFVARAGDPRVGRSSLRAVGEAESQGPHQRYVLYAVEWPDGR